MANFWLFRVLITVLLLVMRAPPRLALITLSLPKLRIALSPKVPTSWLLCLAPRLWARSSIRIRLCSLAILLMAFRSAGMPKVCWTMIALVWGVMTAFRSVGLMLY